MQIIDKNDCYVSRDDLLHLFDNDELMPLSLQLSLRDALLNDKDYVKIEEEKGLEYVYTSDIPTFERLAKLRISELRRQIIDTILEGALEDNHGDSLSLNEIIRQKRNREYIVRQLKEMIAFKKRKSNIVYPDVPYPYMVSVPRIDGEYVASLSYNIDRIVVYNIDGSKVENVDDVEFCKSSFRLLTSDLDNEEDLEMQYDGNYFVVKNKQMKLKKGIVE